MSEGGIIGSFLGALCGVMLLITAFAMFMSSTSCHSQADKMGYPATWGPLQGCMIEVQQGKWIPGESYRYWPGGKPE